MFLMLSVLPLLLVGAFVTHRSFESLEAQGFALLHESATRVATEVRALMHSHQEHLADLETLSRFTRRGAEEQRELLEGLLFHGASFQELTYVDALGVERLRLSRTEAIPPDRLSTRTGREEFEFPTARRETYFGPVRFDHSIREPLATISVPLADRRSGRAAGVLVGEVRFKHVWDLLAGLELPDSVDVFLTGADGQVLGHRNPATVLSGRRIDLASLRPRVRWTDGSDTLTTSVHVGLGRQGLSVVAIQPAAAALALASSNLRITAAVLAVTILAAAGVGLVAARALTQPVETLVDTVEQVRASGRSPEVPQSGPSEVRVIGQAFSELLGELRETMAGLEAEVAERRVAEAAAHARAEELERLTADLRDAQDQLVRKERLATLGQMAGELGHELRNPLAAIGSATALLLRTTDADDASTLRSLNRIADRVEEINRLTGDLLSWARTDTPRRKAVSVRELIDEALRRHPPPTVIAVRVEVPTDAPPVHVDAQQIGQVLGNLVTNAYQAMPAGGLVTISARAHENAMQVDVADTGEGIPEENLERIFQPLFTTKVRGIGFGLAICRSLAEINGGTLAVESTPGHGATFQLSLPGAARD